MKSRRPDFARGPGLEVRRVFHPSSLNALVSEAVSLKTVRFRFRGFERILTEVSVQALLTDLPWCVLDEDHDNIDCDDLRRLISECKKKLSQDATISYNMQCFSFN